MDLPELQPINGEQYPNRNRDTSVLPLGQGIKPTLVWFTGLSGAGKSTTACALEKRLTALDAEVIHLDGDRLRKTLCADLGFSDADRSENIRRIVAMARTLLIPRRIVLISVIAPFQADRLKARQAFNPGEYVEVYVNTPLQICAQRDPKNLYHQAHSGLIHNFTGVDSRYEPPQNPELSLDTAQLSIEAATDAVLARLVQLGRISHHLLSFGSLDNA